MSFMIKTFFLLAYLSLPLFGKGPPNDDFANAQELTGTEYPYKAPGSFADKLDRFRATFEEGEPDHAGKKSHGSVWYSWKADRSQKIRIFLTTNHQEMKLIMAVYTGESVDDLTLVHRYNDFAFPAYSRLADEPFTRNAYLQFDAVKGRKYYIAVGTENEVFKAFHIVIHTHWNNLQPRLELLPANSNWEYLLARNSKGEPVDPKSLDPDFYQTWMFPKRYDGPAFDSGRAPVGYGTIMFGQIRSNLGNKRSYVPPEGKRHTAYLRTSFTPLIDVDAIGIEGVIDDGAIFYLNGKEVLRYNVAEDKDPQDWQTPALSNMANKWSQTERYIFTKSISGLNLPADEPINLSVSLHNQSGKDDDLGMNIRLYALNPQQASK